jgi:putative transposase
MANTYSALHYHIIFATRERIPMIDKEWMQDLHAYLAGTMRHLGTKPEIIGGIADHVHILAEMKPITVIPDVLRDIKKASTTWVQRERSVPKFGWQGGYAIFSVSPFERRDLVRYIANQEVHHTDENSYDELFRMLRAAEIDFDPQYFE